MRSSLTIIVLGCILLAVSRRCAAADDRTVIESARGIPVAYEVDVAVVGGSSGAVAAALEAAKAGARVFLAAPRTYLGEDICGTYRLWLDPSETPTTPLAQRMFAEPPRGACVGEGLPFTYETDVPSADAHKDSDPPAKLCDGHWEDAIKHSVQYGGNVTITLDLGANVELGEIHILAFQRKRDFELARVKVSLSADKNEWRDGPVVENARLGKKDYVESALLLSAPLTGAARYVRLDVEKTAKVERILLGEIVVEPAGAEDPRADIGAPAPPWPMQIKRALDDALLDAGVEFLYGCSVTEVLRGDDGTLAGFVMANRSGRQAVLAKSIIDATPRAAVARLAGVPFETFPAGPQTFERVVVGGEPVEGPGVSVVQEPSPVQTDPAEWRDEAQKNAFRYTLTIDMPDASFASYAEAEQQARDKTWHRDQVAASEFLFQVPPDPMRSRKRVEGAWPGADAINLDAFRPATEDRLYVLGGCADISREAAAQLLRPLALMDVGTRIGAAAARHSEAPRGVRVTSKQAVSPLAGEVRDAIGWIERADKEARTIQSDEGAVPVIGEYDVVVVGGGTGGAPAGIAAARNGAKTLVVEYQCGLGGVGTLGLIGNYYHGYRGGFTAEIDAGVGQLGGSDKPAAPGWNVEWKMEWYRRALREAGAEIWFGALGCGAFVDGGMVKGVAVATPEGRGVVLAKVVIDATGNADVAAAAGASCVYTDGSFIAVQGTGMPSRSPGDSYNNTDYTMTDDSDVLDQWRTFVAGRRKFEQAYDMGQLIDTRERRRVVGDFTISPLDIWNERTYPDSVVLASSDFDTHGYTVHPLFMLRVPERKEWKAYMPLRSLTAKGLEGILVIGLGVSAHRDAMPILRMQPDIQNQGYAAGLIAATAAKAGCGVREVDIKEMQRRLVEIGNLPESVLTDVDSYPFTETQVAEAVRSLSEDYAGVAVVLTQPDVAVPLLREAYGAAETDAVKLVYAHVLAMLDDPSGGEPLLRAVTSSVWDAGWSFTGMGQYGGSMSPVDSYIVALGKTGAPGAAAAIAEKAQSLDASSPFSHHRAVAMALDALGDPAGAATLVQLLAKPDMTGHAMTTIDEAKERALLDNPNQSRDQSLRELILARALYRCGDMDGLGERILREYAQDLRGHLARHAQAVLEEKAQ